MCAHTQSKVCQLSRSEASLIPRRPSFLIIYHVGLLMTPPVSTARGPLQCVRASPCVSISVWIRVCRHAQITCRSHLDWQHEKPPAPQHTHANTHALCSCLRATLDPRPRLVSSCLARRSVTVS